MQAISKCPPPPSREYCLLKFPTISRFAAFGELLVCVLPAEAGTLRTAVTDFAFLYIFLNFYSGRALLLQSGGKLSEVKDAPHF